MTIGAQVRKASALELAAVFIDSQTRIGTVEALVNLRQALIARNLWLGSEDAEFLARVEHGTESAEALVAHLCSERRATELRGNIE
jgi:hypothetical protein